METYPKPNFFYQDSEHGPSKINHLKMLDYLSEAGFGRALINNQGDYVLVRMNNNQITHVKEANINIFLHLALRQHKMWQELEVYIKGVNSYLTPKRLDLLQEFPLQDDMDPSNHSKFYFQNSYSEVYKDGIKVLEYKNLKQAIWTNRIISRNFEFINDEKIGQFEQFCLNISGQDEKKFLRLKSILGYLLHRHKNPSIPKAVILYDRKMGNSKAAEGGSGKTLIAQALSKCRETVFYYGKDIKSDSWFKHQRIELTTDIIVYDDVLDNFDFNSLFPLLSTGLEIERKRQQSFSIPFERSPKVLISSNYYVKGPGGSSDRRRRCEFLLENYYSDTFTPEDDFKNLLFAEWNGYQWNKFYTFMMSCLQTFLQEGLLDDEEDTGKLRLEGLTNSVFHKNIESLVEKEKWVDQRMIVELLQTELPDLSPHKFTKWMQLYAEEKSLLLEKKSSGGEFFLRLTTKNSENEKD